MGRTTESLLGWILDRSADAIDRSSEVPAAKSRLGGRVAKVADAAVQLAGGRGAWTAGLELMEKRRWLAASVAFGDAVRGFEREVGRDHMWTAHALARQGWCFLQLDRPNDALIACQEALVIASRVLPENTERLQQFRELVSVAEDRAQL